MKAMNDHKRDKMAEVSRILIGVENEVVALWPGTDAVDRIQMARIAFERVRLQLAQAWTRQEAAEERERIAKVAATLDTCDAHLRRLASTTVALPRR